MKHHTSQRKQNHIPITFNLLCWFINFTVQAPTIKITLCHHRWRYAQLHLNFLLNYMTGSHPDWRQQLHVGLLEAGAGSALDRRKPPVVQQSVHHRYVVTGAVELCLSLWWDLCFLTMRHWTLLLSSMIMKGPDRKHSPLHAAVAVDVCLVSADLCFLCEEGWRASTRRGSHSSWSIVSRWAEGELEKLFWAHEVQTDIVLH